MSACLHLFFDADVENLALQKYTEGITPHKIRLFYKMSACLQNIYYI